MVQEEVSLQTLTDNEDINIGYSDNDIVVVDSIQQFAEVSAAHVSMSAIAICTCGTWQKGRKKSWKGWKTTKFPKPCVSVSVLKIFPKR